MPSAAVNTVADEVDAFDAFLDDDLNTAGALGWLQTRIKDERFDGFEQRRSAASGGCTCAAVPHRVGAAPERGRCRPRGGARRALERRLARALVQNRRQRRERCGRCQASVPKAVIDLRNEARAAKDFATSDKLRDALAVPASRSKIQKREPIGSWMARADGGTEVITGVHAVAEAVAGGEPVEASAHRCAPRRRSGAT